MSCVNRCYVERPFLRVGDHEDGSGFGADGRVVVFDDEDVLVGDVFGALVRNVVEDPLELFLGEESRMRGVDQVHDLDDSAGRSWVTRGYFRG